MKCTHVRWTNLLTRTVATVGSLLLLSSSVFAQSTANGSPFTWGGQSNSAAPSNADVTDIATGWSSTIALNRDGSLRQWGYSNAPLPPVISNGVKIAASGYEEWFVVVKSDKTLSSWGSMSGGDDPAPSVSGITHAVDVSAAGHHGLVLKDDGTVASFGSSYGYGELDVPLGLDHVVQVLACYSGSLAVKDDGTVVSWGDVWVNPESVAGLTNVKEVAWAYNMLIAVKNDGTVEKLGSANIVVSDLTNIVHASGCFDGMMFITGTGEVIVRGKRYGGTSWASVPSGLTGVKKGSLGPFHPSVIIENTPTIALTTRDFVGGNGTTNLYADISLERAAPTDTVFSITASDGSVASQSVTLPAGETTVRATLAPAKVATNRVVKVTATSSLGSSTSRFTNRAIAVESVALSSSTISGGDTVTVTVTLNAQLTGDATINLSSSEGAVDFSGTVTVTSPSRTVDVQVPTSIVPAVKKAKLSAQYESTTPAYAYLLLNPVPTVKSIAFGSSLYGGQSVSATVYLALNAPVGGTDVTLTTDQIGVSIPATVRIEGGNRSATFDIMGADVSTLTPVVITAVAQGAPVSRTISVKPNDVAAFTLAKSSIVGGSGEIQGTVTLRAIVTTDTVVQLSSPSAAVNVPATVTVLAGSKTATFPVGSSAVTKTTSVKLAASRVGVTRYVYLTLTKG